MDEATPLLPKAAAVPGRRTCFSLMFFTWLSPLLEVGSKKTLDYDDLYPLALEHQTKNISDKFHIHWNELKAKTIPPKKPSLIRALFKTFGWKFFFAGLLRGIRAALLFTAPLVLKAMIAFLNDPSAPSSQGYVLVGIIFVSGILQSLCIRQYTYLSSEVGMCFRSAIQSALFKKSLVIAPSAKRSSGQVTNLMSVDATRVQKLTIDLHSIWVVPYLILLSCGLLWREVGLSFLAGLGVIICFIPLTLHLAKYMKKIQKKVMAFKDTRTKLCNEAWSGIRVIKYEVWENGFSELIQSKRVAELHQLLSFLRIKSFSNAMSNGLPALVAIATFSVYVCFGNALDVGTALTTLSLFNILRLPLLKLPDMVNAVIEAQISLDRLRDYLLEEESSMIQAGALTVPGIVLEGATFQLHDMSEPVLRGVSLIATGSTLIALVGPTGCGKTTLLRGILGEAKAEHGQLFKHGKIAYVAQHPFIQNATIRDNIIFGLAYDHVRYMRAIEVCCLGEDLKILNAGDMTEIGEKGITLSGGQKTRVALARAVYQNAEVYLLDDVLAAVDSQVGNKIFKNCIQGILKSKVVIFATNSPSVLPSCDKIIVLSNNQVESVGKLPEVENHPYLVKMFKDSNSASVEEIEQSVEAEDSELQKAPLTTKKNKSNGKLMVEEERARGGVSWQVYKLWLDACGGGWIVALVVLVYVICEGLSVAATIWISFWSENVDNTSMRFYLCVFVLLQLASVGFIYLRAYTLYMASIQGSSTLFRALLDRVLHAPMSFFESTPLGRIANRFTSDIYTADEQLPTTWSALLVTAITVLYTYATVIGVTPFFVFILVPIGYAYSRSQHYYIQTSRELQRLESASKSPVLSLFGETLEGLSTIRAAGATEAFTSRMNDMIDRNVQALLLNFSVTCWLNLRLEFAGTLVASFAGLCAVWQHGNTSTLFAGLAGVALSYAFTITKYMTQSVTGYSNLQTQMISIERIRAYIELPTEELRDNLGLTPPLSWPQEGSIVIDKVNLRYQPHLPRVLQNLSFVIPARSKIGVVGRTGAGKSSLLVALLRLVEIESGSICIDGINISTLTLKSLRKVVSIIPQDPVIFSGTIRSNLDPFQLTSDDDLWQAIKRVHLTSIQSLDDTVEERGLNFSIGERQLLCIARTLVKNSKIILMDEATASIDPNTDRQIQENIRQVFSNCTTITIAHRLNTIMDSDKILVMDQGTVAEFDTPATLLENPDGIFTQLVRQSSEK